MFKGVNEKRFKNKFLVFEETTLNKKIETKFYFKVCKYKL